MPEAWVPQNGVTRRVIATIVSALMVFTLVIAVAVSDSALATDADHGAAPKNNTTDLPNDGSLLLSQFPSILSECLVLTSVLLLPLTLVVGIRSTFRIVGPMYRFRVFLNELVAGNQTEPCRIRSEDELHDFCDLLNRATESLRAAAEPASTEGESEDSEPSGALPSDAQETVATT